MYIYIYIYVVCYNIICYIASYYTILCISFNNNNDNNHTNNNNNHEHTNNNKPISYCDNIMV